MSGGKRDALRRYPALGFIALAGALAVALPSALTVPNAGPPTLAEFAPVPGQGTGSGGDVGRLGSGSGGADFGSGQGPGSGLSPEDPGQPGARLKRCVGNPARQTEDPLSPPCVAFFDGNNFGATARGVTADEIRIVVHLGQASPAGLHDLDQPNPQGLSATQAIMFDLVRAYGRYFNTRYQLYDRRAHLFAYLGSGTGPEDARADVESIVSDLEPFAIVPIGTSGASTVARAGAERNVLSVSFGAFDRRVQRRLAPSLISYAPDLQDQAKIAGAFVCQKLAGRSARFSGNPVDRTRERTFGVVWQDNPGEPEFRLLKDLFLLEVEQRCDMSDVPTASASTSNAGLADYHVNMAAMSEARVTTVVMFSSITGPSFWGNAASGQGYHPEWVVPGRTGVNGSDDNTVARTYAPAQWTNAIGLSFARRHGRRATQEWYQAFREACSECAEPTEARAPRIYDSLQLLFWGIQASGPRLTDENLDRGLHAIPPRPSRDPSLPAAYFAPGNYSWVKDAMAIRWDAATRDPDGEVGCYRLARSGRRFRAGEWPAGDADIADAGPCQGSSWSRA